MVRFCLVAALVSAGSSAFAQADKGAAPVYTYVEKMPQLPGGGGTAAIVTAIQQRVVYPAAALSEQAEGRVFVGFVIAPDGAVQRVHVIRGFRADCDSAVTLAVRQLPRFEPGQQAGRLVPVSLAVPVTFRLTTPRPADEQLPAADSSRVYTLVQYMPTLPDGGGSAAIATLLGREFRQASAAAGCTLPAVPLYAEVLVGPSGKVLSVRSVNNSRLPAPTGGGVIADPQHRPLPRLPEACEAALHTAGQRLPRLLPGVLNGRRVAVSLTLEVPASAP